MPCNGGNRDSHGYRDGLDQVGLTCRPFQQKPKRPVLSSLDDSLNDRSNEKPGDDDRGC
jgi:hypothetical protein